MDSDKAYIRDLAKKYMELACSDKHNKRRELWRAHNSLEFSKPLIYLRGLPTNELFCESDFKCKDIHYRGFERYFKTAMFIKELDDTVLEPWFEINAIQKGGHQNLYGLDFGLGKKISKGGAAAYNPIILNDEDIEKLTYHSYEIDEEKTSQSLEYYNGIFGDILPIFVNRAGIYTYMWNSDISTVLAKLRGLEQLMYDVYDNPDWLHSLVLKMQQMILKNFDETQEAGGFSLVNHQNQSVPYAKELQDPIANGYNVKTSKLWGYMAAQEFTSFSPEIFNEFMLSYQMPILKKYGLVAYGCCEDMTRKIDLIKKIPNLRRIAVTPFSNAKSCAEQIGKEYVLSFRPNPSAMIANGLDEAYVRRYMREHFEIFKENNNVFDITLKDVETISNKPENVKKWVEIVKEEINKAF